MQGLVSGREGRTHLRGTRTPKGERGSEHGYRAMIRSTVNSGTTFSTIKDEIARFLTRGDGASQGRDRRRTVREPRQRMKAEKSKVTSRCTMPLALRAIMVTVWFSGIAMPVRWTV